ncbi:MAG: peptidoglycan DD-metalloendopeptidase family protein [Anaerolineales bacterium]
MVDENEVLPLQEPEENPERDEAVQPETTLEEAHFSDESLPRVTGHWADRAGFRLVVNLLAVALVLVALFLGWQRFLANSASVAAQSGRSPDPQQVAEPTMANDLAPLTLPVTGTQERILQDGILRQVSLQTIIPSRPRVDVITYTVKSGDTLFAIADKYGLKPESILWSNYDVLKDDPHMLKPGQSLYIPPVDGAYYQWQKGDTLDSVAVYYKVDKSAIVNYPGNHFDLTQSISDSMGLKPGDWIIIPGGSRPIKDWGPPAISRSNPAVARYYGPGACGAILSGAIGSGTFVWPTTEHWISGYGYSAIHRAIDIAGALGNPVFAADSGVVVYAGWSNFGYGNLIVIDHGNGWQTAYAHLNTIAVTCGQSVYQGGFIGQMGTTGNSTGPHLHFEMSYNGAKPNPLDYLP